jgi:single-stranded DNA-binding protein
MTTDVRLIGRVTEDAKLTFTRSGAPMVRFTVACEDPGYNPETRQSELIVSFCAVTWFPVSYETDAELLYKGDEVVAECHIRQWKDNDAKSHTGFQAREVRVLRRGRVGKTELSRSQPAAPQRPAEDPWATSGSGSYR